MMGLDWLVVFKRDAETPELLWFESGAAARKLYDERTISWTGVVLCRVLRDGSRPRDEQPEEKVREPCGPVEAQALLDNLPVELSDLGPWTFPTEGDNHPPSWAAWRNPVDPKGRPRPAATVLLPEVDLVERRWSYRVGGDWKRADSFEDAMAQADAALQARSYDPANAQALLDNLDDPRNGDSLIANLARTHIPKLLEALQDARVETQMIQVNRADPERVIAWAHDPDRKPAITAFTEGPERQLATLIEQGLP